MKGDNYCLQAYIIHVVSLRFIFALHQRNHLCDTKHDCNH